MSSKDSSVTISRDFNLVLSRWRSLPINQSVIKVKKNKSHECNPIDFRGMASSYGRISTDSANMFFCKSTRWCSEFLFSTLVNLRKDGSLFHIAVILDGLGFLRREIIFTVTSILEGKKIALSTY